MIPIGLSMLAFLGFCGFAGLVARSDRGFASSLATHAVLAAVGLLLLGTCAHALLGALHPLAGFILLLVVAFSGLCMALPLWKRSIEEIVLSTHRNILGTGHMRVEDSYDQARRAEHERRWDDAVTLYAARAQEHPADPEPLRRAAEARIAQGRGDDGLQFLHRALTVAVTPEQAAPLIFRIADVLGRDPSRAEEAGRFLDEAAKRLRGTRYAGSIDQRRRAQRP